MQQVQSPYRALTNDKVALAKSAAIEALRTTYKYHHDGPSTDYWWSSDC
jgi:hypothetical protein